MVDGSGSMGGQPEEQARDAALFFVKDLPHGQSAQAVPTTASATDPCATTRLGAAMSPMLAVMPSARSDVERDRRELCPALKTLRARWRLFPAQARDSTLSSSAAPGSSCRPSVRTTRRTQQRRRWRGSRPTCTPTGAALRSRAPSTPSMTCPYQTVRGTAARQTTDPEPCPPQRQPCMHALMSCTCAVELSELPSGLVNVGRTNRQSLMTARQFLRVHAPTEVT